MQKRKSRELDKLQFLEALQKEYASAYVRSKIYVTRKDKAYWKRVCQGKKDTILAICENNSGLPNVFNDESVWKSIYESIIPPEGGLPKFVYRDDVQEAEVKPRDMACYYSKGAPVKVVSGESIDVGYIEEIDLDNEFAYIKLNGSGSLATFSLSKVVRII